MLGHRGHTRSTRCNRHDDSSGYSRPDRSGYTIRNNGANGHTCAYVDNRAYQHSHTNIATQAN